MGDSMKISDKTCCWICGRNWKELKNVVEMYWESGEMTKDRGINAFFEIIDLEKMVSREKIQIPVCVICSQLMLQRILAYLRDNLEIVVKTENPKISINL